MKASIIYGIIDKDGFDHRKGYINDFPVEDYSTQVRLAHEAAIISLQDGEKIFVNIIFK